VNKIFYALIFLSIFVCFSLSYGFEFYANGTYRIRSFNTWGGGGMIMDQDSGTLVKKRTTMTMINLLIKDLI